jgi:hypothetical protein
MGPAEPSGERFHNLWLRPGASSILMMLAMRTLEHSPPYTTTLARNG